MDISDFIGAAKTFHVLGIKVTKDGDLINEWYSEPECRRNIYSATKSFTSCAVGFAVQEGLLSLDEKLTDAFPEDLPDVIDDNLKMATVRDLLTMCLGQEQGSLMGEQRPLYQEDDWVKMSLAIPFQYKPGTHFVYNNVVPIWQAFLYRDVPDAIWSLILHQGFLNILESSGRHGRRILLETVLAQVDCSLHFLNFINSDCFT